MSSIADKPKRSFNPASAADRRRFFIERALRLQSRGTGSNMDRLMAGPVQNVKDMPLLEGLPVMLIGAHAAAAYAPPRNTADVDFIVSFDRYAEAEARMLAGGWEKTNDLVFPNSRLGLVRGAWAKPGAEEKDIMTSGQDWLKEAFSAPVVLRKDGKRVIPRDYLILMKMDSARGHDTGDLTRILGRMDDFEVEKTISVVSRYLDDESVVEDIKQLAEIGRWEYQTNNLNMDDGRKDRGDSGGR